jgi:hypothetical protein
MAIQTTQLIRISRILGLVFIAFMLVAGPIACKKAGEGTTGEEGLAVKEGVIEFEGAVKVSEGKYLYVPKVRGFDLVVQGELISGTLSDLVGKVIKGHGSFLPERPSVLAVDEIQLENEAGEFDVIFTRTEEVLLDDYLDVSSRDGYEMFQELAYNKAEGWEGKEKAKVSGELQVQEDGTAKILITDASGRDVGAIIIDNMTDYASYYVKKLSLFNKFWFYINIGETVDWSSRRRSRELFHADVLFAGLY